MKRIKTLLLFAALPLFGIAQTKEQALQGVKQRGGWYYGIGIYQVDQTTHWKYEQTPPPVGKPFYNAAEGFGHDLNRTLLTLGIEKKSLFGTPGLRDGIFTNHYDNYGTYLHTDYSPIFNFVDVDFGADVMVSPFGKTTANWLNDDNNQISSGGITAGVSAYLKLQWIIFMSPKLRMNVLSPGVGLQYLYVHNNGQGVASQPLVNDFNYKKGWNENLTAMFLSIGTLGFEGKRFSIAPEFRLFIANTSSTSLKPERLIGDVKIEDSPFIVSYGIKFTHKL
jgi:hypothetical protein